jgi:hypothetical protein
LLYILLQDTTHVSLDDIRAVAPITGPKGILLNDIRAVARSLKKMDLRELHDNLSLLHAAPHCIVKVTIQTFVPTKNMEKFHRGDFLPLWYNLYHSNFNLGYDSSMLSISSSRVIKEKLNPWND